MRSCEIPTKTKWSFCFIGIKQGEGCKAKQFRFFWRGLHSTHSINNQGVCHLYFSEPLSIRRFQCFRYSIREWNSYSSFIVFFFLQKFQTVLKERNLLRSFLGFLHYGKIVSGEVNPHRITESSSASAEVCGFVMISQHTVPTVQTRRYSICLG